MLFGGSYLNTEPSIILTINTEGYFIFFLSIKNGSIFYDIDIQLTQSIVNVEGSILESPISVVKAVAPALRSTDDELLGRPGIIGVERIVSGTPTAVIEAGIPVICRLTFNGSVCHTDR